MIVTQTLTLGQLTFTLRVALQIISYGGFFLTGLIVLATIPRVASAETHGVINRIVGRSSATTSSIKWAFQYLRGKSGDPITSHRFLIAILLLVLFSLFVTVSDVGFIGLYACSVPYPPIINYPGSISTDALARAAIASTMMNGTDPATIAVHRCDAISADAAAVSVCTAWRNSTYADPLVFKGLNSTDSDILTPRRMRLVNTTMPDAPTDLISFFTSPGPLRVVDPVISNGLAIVPHQTGVRVVVGVPQLASRQKVVLSKTMALEADVGCMSLGIYSSRGVDDWDATDLYATNGTWRTYTGPEYFRDVLSTYVDQIRQIYLPLFDVSSLDRDGFMAGIHSSSSRLANNAAIHIFNIPTLNSPNGDPNITFGVLTGCANAVARHLDVPSSFPAESCALLAVGGSSSPEGRTVVGLSRMLCASATQVNMVSATVETSAEGSLSIDLIRLPSVLNFFSVPYWHHTGNAGLLVYTHPVERFTLADNASGPTSHFIPSGRGSTTRSWGPGNGGNVILPLASIMINGGHLMEVDQGLPDANSFNLAGIKILDEGDKDIDYSPSLVTTWSGQVGASFVVESIAYNGWAALDSSPITVYSTGGRLATCYEPLYALAFLPLALTAAFVACWALLILVGSSFAGHERLKESYGGLSPYVDAVCPANKQKETRLAWKNDSKPWLEILPTDHDMYWDDAPMTALRLLKTPQSAGG